MRLTFGDRKRLACGQVMYEGLEGCKERFSLDLASQICPRRRQTSNIKLLSCQTMEDFYDCVDKEGNTNEDGVCLLRSGVVHVTCTGFQKEEEQLEAMLSAAVQTGSLELLTGCIKQWTSEKQPRSAANLEFIRDCAWKKVIYTKDEFDGICEYQCSHSADVKSFLLFELIQ
ncbi:protein ELYS-like [Phaenicophaeus curvirostris]|uniref:protein ELYS-like n=1 Tax=Phaenicophaeus curvirostris TaxID=33595 RepID=UPI0037F0F126